MRILFANRKLDFASASSYSLDLAIALRSLGDEVQLCTTGGPLYPVFLENQIETYIAKFNYFSYRKLIQYLRDFSPDVIHVQNQRSVSFAQKLSAKLHVPHVVTVHRTPPPDAEALTHPLLAGVVAANEVIRETLVNDFGVAKSLIRVVKHGVDIRTLAPDSPAAAPGAESPGRIPVVGSVGRLTRIKGHHVLLEAARRVLDAGVEVMFMVVGEGKEESALRRLTRELRLEYNVTFSPHIPGRRELYRIFDIVVVPTLTGGVGTTALEAMGMGKPVIASAVGEVLHILQDRKTGVLVPESDAQTLAERIIELVRDPELGRRLGTEARKYVAGEMALAPMVKATRQFYDDALLQVAERKIKV